MCAASCDITAPLLAAKCCLSPHYLSCLLRSHATHDLFNHIAEGDFPEWDLQVQTMDPAQQLDFDFDPLDATKVRQPSRCRRPSLIPNRHVECRRCSSQTLPAARTPVMVDQGVDDHLTPSLHRCAPAPKLHVADLTIMPSVADNMHVRLPPGVAGGPVPAAAGGAPGAGPEHRQPAQRERADRLLAREARARCRFLLAPRRLLRLCRTPPGEMSASNNSQ